MTSQPSDPVIGFKQGICKWAHSLIGQDLSEAVFCKTPYLWGFGFSLFRFLSLSLDIPRKFRGETFDHPRRVTTSVFMASGKTLNLTV